MRIPAAAAVLSACLATFAAWPLAAASPAGVRVEAQARPGSVVRWPGTGIESCGRGQDSWAPLADGCWFPIDLLQPQGPVAVHRSRLGQREEATITITEYPYPVERITVEDAAQVDLSAASLARVRREQERVRSLWSLDGPARFDLPLAEPLDDLGAAGSFGSRRFFNDQPRSPHSGADYAAAEGTPVHSVAPGRVVLADDLFFSGNSVFIDHGGGMISMYFHLSSVLVAEGQQIARGDLIGKVGHTGRATGPHLHFGLRWQGARVDPDLLFCAGAEIPELGPAP